MIYRITYDRRTSDGGKSAEIVELEGELHEVVLQLGFGIGWESCEFNEIGEAYNSSPVGDSEQVRSGMSFFEPEIIRIERIE